MNTNNKKNQVKRIFDSISDKYDFLNHLLSLGIDFYWRKKSLKLTGMKENASLLDVACGTGDFAIAAEKSGVEEIVGADLSINMLKLFGRKSSSIRGNTVQCVAEKLPFVDTSFTNITVAFGVRNFYDIREGFESFYRVLKPGGKATILEFRLPSNSIMRRVYLFYFNSILPKIGRLISKDKEAYTYLPESVQEFDESIDLSALLKDAGFEKIERHSITFGIVQVIIAEK
jgi:demethylmenaquinone methyltransferase/2-methoxy-6-polyprenyl-1,4-benzoquinol methylase